jgi:DNA-binding transcriptional regulator YiaG
LVHQTSLTLTLVVVHPEEVSIPFQEEVTLEMGNARREVPKRLPAKLRFIRETLGLTQEEMLKELRLPKYVRRNYLSRWESGEREPTLSALRRYSEVAGVWINAIVDDSVDLPAKLPCPNMHPGIRPSGHK